MLSLIIDKKIISVKIKGKMASLKEIEKMGEDAFLKSVLDLSVNCKEEAFNTDIPLDEQIRNFSEFETTADSYKAILEDAKKF